MTSHPSAAGPSRSITDGKLAYVRNPSYWRKSATGHALPVPRQDHLRADARLHRPHQLAARGKVDILQTADTLNLVQAKKDPNLVVQPVTGSSSTIIVLNSHKAPFDDIRMRQAFNYALDREALNKGTTPGTPAAGVRPARALEPLLRPQGPAAGHDLAKAKALVAQ